MTFDVRALRNIGIKGSISITFIWVDEGRVQTQITGHDGHDPKDVLLQYNNQTWNVERKSPEELTLTNSKYRMRIATVGATNCFVQGDLREYIDNSWFFVRAIVALGAMLDEKRIYSLLNDERERHSSFQLL